MKWLLVAIGLGSVLAGCPAELRHPERFPEVPPCAEGLDALRIFEARCGSPVCHGDDSANPAAELDLVSPGVEARLYSVPSTQCDGLVRIDPTSPDESFLLVKLVGPPAGCGDRMPLVGFLSSAELACIRSWVRMIAAGPIPDAGLMDAAMDAPPIDAPMDAPVDAPPIDAPIDVPMSDAPMDAPVDLTADASIDAGTDGSVDAGGDGP